MPHVKMCQQYDHDAKMIVMPVALKTGLELP